MTILTVVVLLASIWLLVFARYALSGLARICVSFCTLWFYLPRQAAYSLKHPSPSIARFERARFDRDLAVHLSRNWLVVRLLDADLWLQLVYVRRARSLVGFLYLLTQPGLLARFLRLRVRWSRKRAWWARMACRLSIVWILCLALLLKLLLAVFDWLVSSTLRLSCKKRNGPLAAQAHALDLHASSEPLIKERKTCCE